MAGFYLVRVQYHESKHCKTPTQRLEKLHVLIRREQSTTFTDPHRFSCLRKLKNKRSAARAAEHSNKYITIGLHAASRVGNQAVAQAWETCLHSAARAAARIKPSETVINIHISSSISVPAETKQ